MDKDSKGNRWIISGRKLLKVTVDRKIIPIERLEQTYPRIQIDEKEQFWIWGQSQQDVYLKVNENASIQKSLFFDKNKTPKGFFFKSNKKGQFIYFERKREELKLLDGKTNDILTSINISTWFEDLQQNFINLCFLENENTLWVCTFEGIFRVSFNQNPFHQYLVGESTRSMIKWGDDKLWVSAYSGLYEVDLNTKESRLIKSSNVFGSRHFFKNKKNEYWLTQRSKRILKLTSADPSTWKEYNLVKEKAVNDNTLALFESSVDNSFWAGTSDGLYRYNPKEDRFIRFKKFNEFAPKKELHISGFKEIEESKLVLLASTNGIYELDLEKGITNHYCPSNNNFPYENIWANLNS